VVAELLLLQLYNSTQKIEKLFSSFSNQQFKIMNQSFAKLAILPPIYHSWVKECSNTEISPKFKEFPLDVFRHIKNFLLLPPKEWNQISTIRQKKSEIRSLFAQPYVISRYNMGQEYNDFNHIDYETFNFVIEGTINLNLVCCCYCGEYNDQCRCSLYYMKNRIYKIDEVIYPEIPENE
jgi:hypothetical protein